MEDTRYFNIFTKDSFRQRIEKASKGRLTVIYDKQGNPSIMLRLVRKRTKDVLGLDEEDLDKNKINNNNSFASYLLYQIFNKNDNEEINDLLFQLNSYYPCFKGFSYISKQQIKNIPEVFVGIFPSTTDVPYSMPGIDTYSVAKNRDDYSKYTYKSICDTVRKKGKNWRIMSIWEYSLIRNYYLYKIGLNNCSKTFRTSTGTLYIKDGKPYYEKNQNSTETSSYKVYTVGIFVSIPSSILVNMDVNSFIGKRLLGFESNVSGNIIEAKKTKIDYSYLPNAYEPMLEGGSKGVFFVLNEVTGDVFFKKKEKVKIIDEENNTYYDLGHVTSETFILGRRTFNDNLNFENSYMDDDYYELFMFFESFCTTPLLIDGLFLMNSIYTPPDSGKNYVYSFPTFISYRGQITDYGLRNPSALEAEHVLYFTGGENSNIHNRLKTASNSPVKIFGERGNEYINHILSTKFIFYNCAPFINKNLYVNYQHKHLKKFLNFITFMPVNSQEKSINFNYLENKFGISIPNLLNKSLLCFDINRNEIFHNEISNRVGRSSLFVGWDYDDIDAGLLSVVNRNKLELSLQERLYMFLMGFNNNFLKIDLEDPTLKAKPFYNKIEKLKLIKKFSQSSGNFFIRANESDFYLFSNGGAKVFSPSTASYELFDTLDRLRKDVRCIDNPLFNAMFHSGGKHGKIKDDPHPNTNRFNPNITNDDMDMLCDAANKFTFRLVYVPEY